MSLPKTIDALRGRVLYVGFDYRTAREVIKSGREWKDDAVTHRLVVQRNEDSLAAFSTPTKDRRREMQFEIYERADECAPTQLSVLP